MVLERDLFISYIIEQDFYRDTLQPKWEANGFKTENLNNMIYSETNYRFQNLLKKENISLKDLEVFYWNIFKEILSQNDYHGLINFCEKIIEYIRLKTKRVILYPFF
jgi:hypothetical protein